jgi:hypothetical protein
LDLTHQQPSYELEARRLRQELNATALAVFAVRRLRRELNAIALAAFAVRSEEGY